MPFWKKSFSKARGVYYPRAIVHLSYFIAL